MSDPDAPQVSWKTLDEGAAAVASDGAEVGTVKEIAGDHRADIFDGLVISRHRSHDRYVPAEQVRGIWEDRVELAPTASEIEALPAYTEPRSERWQPDRRGSLGERLGRAARSLLGRGR